MVSWKSQRFKKYRPEIQGFHADPNILGNPNDSKNDRQKQYIFHADPTVWKMVNIFVENSFDLVGLTYVLKICNLKDLARFHHRKIR